MANTLHITGTTDHARLLYELYEILEPVLEYSVQAVYLYLDDEHRVCNEHFSSLLGYRSPMEWAKLKGPFPTLFVAEESQDTLIDAYQDSMEDLASASFPLEWRKKFGGTVATTVILVPISYGDHVFALHFIEKKDQHQALRPLQFSTNDEQPS